MATPPRVLFYVQHLLGIGHLVRASRIARSLVRDGFETTIVMGGMPVENFPGPGVRLAALPPIRAADAQFSALTDERGGSIDDTFKNERRRRLLEIFATTKPDILIVEAFPFGRRQLRFELLPLLDAAKAARTPLVVSSVRDILQENRKPGRDAETIDTILSYFDLVMVHGDPSFATLEDTFPPAAEIADRVAYTGLVAGEAVEPSSDVFDVVVSAGGGRVGERLIACAYEAARAGGRWCIITGGALRGEAGGLANIEFHTFRPDFPALLGSAGVSVSQAGYNTVCDVLRAGVRAVLVPFATDGETEQTERAGRLAARHIARVISEDTLTPAALIEAIRAAPRLRDHGLDLEGAEGSVRVLRQRLARSREIIP